MEEQGKFMFPSMQTSKKLWTSPQKYSSRTGCLSTFGPLEDMEVSLANFRSETLPLHTPEGNEFTVQYYITSNKATRERMYLKTQIKSTVHRHTPMIDITDDDSDLLNPVFPGNEVEYAVSQILGTSAEREQLKSEQE